MFASRPIVLAYHSSLALLTDLRSLSFCIAVTDNYVQALISFFSSALLGGSVLSMHDYEVVTSLVEIGVLFPFLEW